MDIFERNELILGKNSMELLRKSHVVVFGCGGVGSYTVEALVRGGIGNITIIDGDIVAESNINRQLVATTETIGMKKAEVACRHARAVNPQINAKAECIFFTAENADSMDFSQYDYVVDAIDTVSSKLLIIEKAKAAGIPLISSMGTGNKLDPTRFEIADISNTSVCPLARVMRYELKKRNIKNIKVLYSKEEPIKHGTYEGGKPIPGSVSFVPSCAGLIIAGEVIKDLIKEK